MTTAFSVVRALLACALALVMFGSSVQPLQPQDRTSQTSAESEMSKTTKEQTSNSTSVEVVKRSGPESRTSYSRDELNAFMIVGVAFAVAWLLVGAFREWERWKEFEARKEERLIEAATRQTKALAELSRAQWPKGEDPTGTAEFVATLLQSTAEFIKPKTKSH